MDLQKVLQNRRSIRIFKKGEKVGLVKVKSIINAGLLAPKASNRQNWEAVYIDDLETIKKLHYECGAQKTVLNSQEILLICYNSQFNPASSANIQSTSAAVENMLLKCYELGVGGCWIAAIGEVKKIQKLIGLPENLIPLCYILLGLPDEKPSKPPSKNIEDVLSIGKYSPKGLQLKQSINPDDWTIEQVAEHQKYMSRASNFGHDYDKFDDEEIGKINKIIQHECSGETAFFMSYDGTILKKINATEKSVDIELTKEAVDFVKHKKTKINYLLLQNLDKKKFDNLVFLFSLERIPNYDQMLIKLNENLNRDGKMFIFLKNSFSFYGLMYYSLKNILRFNTLNHFYMGTGPFKPINVFGLRRVLGAKFCTKTQSMYFMPIEIKVFRRELNQFLLRHNKVRVLSPLIKLAANIVYAAMKVMNIFKIPLFSSSLVVIAKKK